MKRTISILIVWLVLFQTCMAQTAPVQEDVTIDTVYRYHPSKHKEISLDILIGPNPPSKNSLEVAWLYPSPTLIEMKEINKGEKYAKVYVNADNISVICNGITAGNREEYRAYREIFFNNKPTMPGPPEELSIYVDNFNAPSVESYGINEEKRWLYKCNFHYFIKDKAGKIVSSLTIEFVYPKPEPMLIVVNEKKIREMKDRPVETSIYIPGYKEKNKKELALANKAAIANDPNDFPSKLVLRLGIRTVLFQFKTLNHRADNFMEYRLGNGEWKTTAKGEFPFLILEDLQPGKYKLQVRYPLQTNIFEYEFEITPAFIQTTAFKVMAGILITAVLGTLLFLIYSFRQKRKLKEEVNKRSQLQHQITYLQSQLQPHFIFNALNSIQGLINKRNIEDANIYISKFGALLHEVIGKNDQTMQPLAAEIKQLEYYLQLEQLRFKFQYKIAVAGDVNTTEINIPTMLLQPFVENAIKHGIVLKKEAGVIELAISKSNNDLLIEIKDNGEGYDINTTKAGRGNTMVEERVRALNGLLKDQTIKLTTRSAIQEGTSVSINFSNWF